MFRGEVVASLDVAGGWWPPGEGEPGTDWGYEPTELRLAIAAGDGVVDVHQVTADGPRALVSIPTDGLAAVLAAALAAERDATHTSGGDRG